MHSSERVLPEGEDPKIPDSLGYPMHAYDFSDVRRIDADTVAFATFQNGLGGTVTDHWSYKKVEAPVIDGKKRTELIDFVINVNNYNISKYNKPYDLLDITKHTDYGYSKYNQDQEVYAAYADGINTQVHMNFYFDNVNVDSYGAGTIIHSDLKTLYHPLSNIKGNVVYTNISFCNRIDNNYAHYTTYQGSLEEDSTTAPAYDFIIYHGSELKGKQKEDFYYQLSLLFGKETKKMTDLLDIFAGKSWYLESEMGISYKALGFENLDSASKYKGGILNGRAYRLYIDENTNFIGLKVTLKN